MYRGTVLLPYGYEVNKRTKEEGGGWVLTGGVKREPSADLTEEQQEEANYGELAGRRKVASWTERIPVSTVEKLARLDALARGGAITDEEMRKSAREFVLTTGRDVAGVGLPSSAYRHPEEKKSGKKVLAEWKRYKKLWGEDE